MSNTSQYTNKNTKNPIMSEKKKFTDKKQLVQPICNILQKFASEISPYEPDLISQFESNYLGLANNAHLNTLTSKLRGSPSDEKSEDGVQEDITKKVAKFREGVMATKIPEVSVIIFRAVLKSVLFRTMDRVQLQEVINVMQELRVKNGDIIIKGGETSNKMYVVEYGIYRKWPMRPTLEQIAFANLIKREDNFSEMGLIYDVVNDMTVQAVTDGILWYINRKQFNRILLGPSKSEIAINRTLLTNTPILKKLNDREIGELIELVFPREYERGAFIYCQGDIPNGVFIVETGTVAFSTLGNRSNQIDITTVGQGGIFGESSLVSREPRLLSAYAKEPCRLLFLNLESLEHVVGPCIDVTEDF